MHALDTGHPHHLRAPNRTAARAAEPAAWPARGAGARERHHEREQAMTGTPRPARPHGAPAYYLGRPASLWIATAVGRRHRPSGPSAAGR
jgi:hypothetical protein